MGLVVAALLALTLAYFRRIRGWITGQPVPQVTMRPSEHGAVLRFLNGLGKVKAPARATGPASPEQLRAWREGVVGETAAPPKSAAPEGPTDCDVLVVGAGPNRLMAAYLLHLGGVNVHIVDKSGGPATESRAFAIQARTVELFRNLGLADELISHGILNTSVKFHIKGRYVGGLDFDRSKALDTPYPFILMAPQNEVEGILIDALVRRGVRVSRDRELTALTQDEFGVVASLSEGLGGRTSTLRCRYVVGADGAHSTVRKQLGLSFEGGKYAQNFLLADCTVQWPFDHTNFRIFMNRERIGLFLPLEGARLSRVMATDLGAPPEGDAHGLVRSPMSLEELQEGLSKAMSVPITLSNPVWTTRYRVHLRGVEHYARGRGFLIGDAAHIHSPAGGQGMNTGLQDAANLAWKLTAVLRTAADPALLQTYHDERHPIGIELLRFTDRLYKLTADLQGWRARLRDFVGPFLVARMSAAPLPHRKSFRRLSQISLKYRPSHINRDALLYSLKGPLAGERAPEARINGSCSMFDRLTGYRTHVVALSRKHLLDDEVGAMVEQLAAIEALGGVATHLIGRVACRRDPRVEFVESPQIFEHYGLNDDRAQALFIVRADGYVAWRMDDIDFDACRLHLSHLHGGFAALEAQRLAAQAR